MNAREQQLRERDVRREAPELDPAMFLKLYLASNFPQTAALPSREQKEQRQQLNDPNDDLKSGKKIALSGTQYDNPGGY